MKFPAFTHSIHWRLLSWIALLLGFSLLALDFAAYEIHLSKRIGLLDEDLRLRVAALSAVFVMGGADRFDHGPPKWDENNFPPMQPDEFDGEPPHPDGDLHEPHSRPGDFAPPPFAAARVETAAKRYAAETASGYYFAIWISDSASPYKQSTNHATVSRPPLRSHDTGTYVRTQDGNREIFHATEHGECVLIGRTLAPELKEARQFGSLLGLGSAALLALAIGGAWLIIAGALRPVKKISAAAAKISSGDLSQRINVAETESELGQLATVLNSTFDRLEAAFARQQQFTADAAHELRTPVSVMLTHTQNGLASGCACEEHREAFEACQRAAQRMKKLIAALLALARLDNGPEGVPHAKFDFAQTVRECVDMLRPLAEARRVTVLIELTALEIPGDPEQLAQVVINLLTNAIQYNREGGGKVGVELEQVGRQGVLTVSDTGRGIPAADLPRVFDRFYRADKARSSSGLGLGLAISKAIVTAHGGKIEVASSENLGTTFTVTLPL